MKNNLQQLATNLGHNFSNIDLLKLALTHRSTLNESGVTESNERLEFLGDAVLELLVSDYLYKTMPDEQEGVLTAARSAIVRTESLGDVAKKLGLGEALYISKGEEKTGGRVNQSLLADTCEAVIGAIYLDGGYQSVQAFFDKHMTAQAKLVLSGSLKDAKSLLQERVQELGYQAPIYTTLQEMGPDHEKTFVIAVEAMGQKQLALGRGKSKQTAQQQAARMALKKIEQNN